MIFVLFMVSKKLKSTIIALSTDLFHFLAHWFSESFHDEVQDIFTNQIQVHERICTWDWARARTCA